VEVHITVDRTGLHDGTRRPAEIVARDPFFADHP
jgi:hypothetical protein